MGNKNKKYHLLDFDNILFRLNIDVPIVPIYFDILQFQPHT